MDIWWRIQQPLQSIYYWRNDHTLGGNSVLGSIGTVLSYSSLVRRKKVCGRRNFFANYFCTFDESRILMRIVSVYFSMASERA